MSDDKTTITLEVKNIPDKYQVKVFSIIMKANVEVSRFIGETIPIPNDVQVNFTSQKQTTQ